MDFFHVVPPFWLLVDLAEVLVQAALPQVFGDDFLAINSIEVIFDVIWCAVFTIGEALVVFEILGAGWASPSHKPRLNLNVSRQLVRILIEFFDEIQSSLVV